MYTRLQDRRNNVWCFCVSYTGHQWRQGSSSSPSCYQCCKSCCRHTCSAESSVSYRQPVGKVGYLQTQVKAAHFMVKDSHRVKSLKPFLIPNPSLSRSEEKTTLSLKERSACFPTALRVKGLSHSCRTQEAGLTTIYPRLFRTCPLQKSATKQRLKAFPVKGREVAPTSSVGCSTYKVTLTGAELKH